MRISNDDSQESGKKIPPAESGNVKPKQAQGMDDMEPEPDDESPAPQKGDIENSSPGSAAITAVRDSIGKAGSAPYAAQGSSGRPAAANQSNPSAAKPDGTQEKWKKLSGAAKIKWGKLTEEELQKSDGQEKNLTGLVQRHYSLTQDVAAKQVREFFEKNSG